MESLRLWAESHPNEKVSAHPPVVNSHVDIMNQDPRHFSMDAVLVSRFGLSRRERFPPRQIPR